MKKILLWAACAGFIGHQAYADPAETLSPPTQTSTSPSAPPTSTVPSDNLPSVNSAAPSQPEINCDFKISSETKNIEQSLVTRWAEKAVVQAFTFDPINSDSQLQKLQPCFTEQGWTGFNTALQKSGNLEAIKSQKLTVSSQMEGAPVVTEAKENQWKIALPLQVIYQNDKEKVTQSLNVDLTVSRKVTGDLGITQMIAAPKGTATQENSNNPSNNMHSSPENPSPATPTGASAPTQPTAPSNPSAAPNSTTPAEQQPNQLNNRPTQPTAPANNP